MLVAVICSSFLFVGASVAQQPAAALAPVRTYLDERLAAAVAQFGQTHRPTIPIEDNALTRSSYHYVDLIARATGLDFVKLARLKFFTGNNGVSDVIDRVPANTPQGIEARRLRTLVNLTSTLRVAEIPATLATVRNPRLAPAAQRLAYLQLFVEGFRVMTSNVRTTPYDERQFPKALACSRATGFDYQTLAFIEAQGGPSSIRHVVTNIPDVPGAAACLAALQ